MANRVTARKYLGDDRASWAVFIDGRPFVTGLTRSEVPYYRKQAEKRLEADAAARLVAMQSGTYKAGE